MIGFLVFVGMFVTVFGILVYAVIVMYRDPGPCREEWKQGIAGTSAYTLYTCDRKKDHAEDHLDYNEQVGWRRR